MWMIMGRVEGSLEEAVQELMTIHRQKWGFEPNTVVIRPEVEAPDQLLGMRVVRKKIQPGHVGVGELSPALVPHHFQKIEMEWGK